MKVIDGLREAFRAVQFERPELTDDIVEAALMQIVFVLGGERVVIPKNIRSRRLSAETRAAAYADRYSGPRGEIAMRHGISRATLYRLMKKGTKGTANG